MTRPFYSSLFENGLNSVKWIPKCLKVGWMEACKCRSIVFNLCSVWKDANLLNSLVTMDEIWVHFYDTETKKQSMEWRHSSP